jgi:ATP-binding cassette subfamily F protein uup
VTSTVVFEGTELREYVGGYDDWLRQRPAAVPAAAIERPSRPTAQPRRPPETRSAPGKLSYKNQRELATLPAQIEALEAEQAELHARMADPAFYQQAGGGIAVASERLTALETELEAAYARWEALEELKSG